MNGRRLGILVTLGAAIVGVAVLVLSGTGQITARTFALGAENNFQVALIHPGTQVCEGPVTASQTSNGVGVWGGGIKGPATLTVTAREPSSGRTLASGPLRAQPAENRWTARLDHAIAADQPVQICLHGESGTFTLSGSSPVRSDVVMTGSQGHAEFSLVLLSIGRHSLLGRLPTVFARASLWRPSWVGAWTFWVLAIALLATFALAVRAVASAAADDDLDGAGDRPSADAGPDAPGPTTPSTDRLEASEDRPQPVT